MRKSSFPFYHYVLEILLGSDNEESFYRMYPEQTSKVIIYSIEDVIRTLLIRDYVYCLGVMH